MGLSTAGRDTTDIVRVQEQTAILGTSSMGALHGENKSPSHLPLKIKGD